MPQQHLPNHNHDDGYPSTGNGNHTYLEDAGRDSWRRWLESDVTVSVDNKPQVIFFLSTLDFGEITGDWMLRVMFTTGMVS